MQVFNVPNFVENISQKVHNEVKFEINERGADMKRFNVTGLCVKEKHYMVDTSRKIEEIMKLVDYGYYFTINRARQYGKTTTLFELRKKLQITDAICVPLSFEGVGESMFSDSTSFCQQFLMNIAKEIERTDEDFAAMWQDSGVTDFGLLGFHLDKLCEGKKIVLLIDEVDKTSNNLVFLGFLGMLRSRYLAREEGRANTFHSVILAGVHDIKNIKVKLVKEGLSELQQGERVHNSPWNIAADFKVDMSFSPSDIATMLNDYEKDFQTGMDVESISNEIYHYTGGYPFLVSRVCQYIDEELWKDWSIFSVREAVIRLIHERNTLFDDITKNLESYSNLYDFLYSIVMQGAKRGYMLYNNDLYLAATFGYIKEEDKKTIISCRIFEVLLLDYFVSIDEKAKSIEPADQRGLYHEITESGAFDMELCLRRFAEYYKEIYAKRHIAFLEEHGELLLLSFFKPLINGKGFFHIESRLMDKRRIDIIAEYRNEQFIIELKLWRGEAYRDRAISQLLGYMDAKNLDKGYLVTFDLRKDEHKEFKAEWVDACGKRIFEVIM